MYNEYEIDILMATYNGEIFLEEQLQSVLKQTYSNWRLIIKDDGSSDGTIEIIKKYLLLFPRKIILIEGPSGLGACQNFAYLTKYATALYVMFADQDDVWLPEKIEVTLNKMKSAEKQHGQDMPLLIHSDLMIVGEGLQLIANSFWKYQNIDDIEMNDLSLILFRNTVTGCTVMINQMLLKLCPDVPQNAIMHDWWYALVAAAFGKVLVYRKPTILYRQHGNNDVGAQRWNSINTIKKAYEVPKIRLATSRIIIQATAFKEYYKKRVNNGHLSQIDAIVNLPNFSLFRRIISIIKNKYYKTGLVRSIGFVLFLGNEDSLVKKENKRVEI